MQRLERLLEDLASTAYRDRDLDQRLDRVNAAIVAVRESGLDDRSVVLVLDHIVESSERYIKATVGRLTEFVDIRGRTSCARVIKFVGVIKELFFRQVW